MIDDFENRDWLLEQRGYYRGVIDEIVKPTRADIENWRIGLARIEGYLAALEPLSASTTPEES